MIKEISKNNLFFRGHEDETYLLEPGVYRKDNTTKKNLIEHEDVIYREIISKAPQDFSGKNTLEIKGSVKRVSEKHLNFEGIITQKINGTTYIRSKKTTFFDEGKGKFWRLQNKINDAGFVDYIDIYK